MEDNVNSLTLFQKSRNSLGMMMISKILFVHQFDPEFANLL
jgi:hypothetical protein